MLNIASTMKVLKSHKYIIETVIEVKIFLITVKAKTNRIKIKSVVWLVHVSFLVKEEVRERHQCDEMSLVFSDGVSDSVCILVDVANHRDHVHMWKDRENGINANNFIAINKEIHKFSLNLNGRCMSR